MSLTPCQMCDHTNKINFIYNYNGSIHHNFMCVSDGVVLIPGLCCLKFLFACNTQLWRVVICFEIRWIEVNTHRVVPDLFMRNDKQYSSCLANAPASNEHQRKGPRDPPPCSHCPPPPTVCLPSVYLLPSMWSDIPDLLPLYHIFV